MAMTLVELRERWTRCWKAVDRELRWRNSRYPVGHAERDAEVGEVTQLLVDMTAIKNELKERIEAEQAKEEVRQPRLLDAPQRATYG